MQGLRDDGARGLDDGWSRWSRTVTVETALVCSTRVKRDLGEGGSGDLGEGGSGDLGEGGSWMPRQE